MGNPVAQLRVAFNVNQFFVNKKCNHFYSLWWRKIQVFFYEESCKTNIFWILRYQKLLPICSGIIAKTHITRISHERLFQTTPKALIMVTYRIWTNEDFNLTMTSLKKLNVTSVASVGCLIPIKFLLCMIMFLAMFALNTCRTLFT